MDKIKLKATEFLKKTSEFVKKYPFWVGLAIGAMVISVIVAVILSLPEKEAELSSDLESSPEEVSYVRAFSVWGEGITSGVPQFSGNADSLDLDSDDYASAYYSDVTIEQANGYAEKLQNELGITFSYSDKFPRSAIYGEKIIVIHYNVTEMKLSVTVVKAS